MLGPFPQNLDYRFSCVCVRVSLLTLDSLLAKDDKELDRRMASCFLSSRHLPWLSGDSQDLGGVNTLRRDWRRKTGMLKTAPKRRKCGGLQSCQTVRSKRTRMGDDRIG